MTYGLTVIPEAPETFALAEAEPRIGEWIDTLDDLATIREAQRRLDALRSYYDRGSEDAIAARRLSLRAERRMGMLVPPEQGKRTDLQPLTTGEKSHAEEQALSRARALAAVPQEVFDRVIAEPNPSRAKVIRTAGDEAWDDLVDRVVSPETLRLSAIDAWIADVMALAIAFDRIDPPPTASEAGPAGPAIQSMLRRLRRDAHRMEVVQ